MEKHICDISFIIIAANEEFAIQKCLESIDKLPLVNCEIICIDSSPNDYTVDVMKQYSHGKDNFKILKIVGDCVGIRSIARNAGFKASTKKCIFFIDGDIEIKSEFILEAINKLKNYDCVSGDLKEYLYDSRYERIKKVVEKRYNTTHEKKIYYTGGIFITKKDVIQNVGLFNESIRCEDIEFTLRISRAGYSIIQIPEIMGIHHTIDLSNRRRIVNFIKTQHGIYRGIIVRENIFYFKSLFQFLREESSFFWGLPFYFLSFLGLLLFGPKFLFISFALFTMDMLHGWIKKKEWFHRVYLHYITPIHILKGMFFCFNLKPGNYVVKELKG
jgi:glycosyltransferase involved in cell wall biosynthesis